MKTEQKRFEAKFVKATTGCWEWTAYKDRKGYGTFGFAGRMQQAPRVSYQLYVGEIPDNLQVLHRCDNPSCVNPAHLFLGTIADNMHDRENKGRGADHSGEKNWRAKLTEEQVRTIREMGRDGNRGADIARSFRVATSTIYSILRYSTWMNL